MTEDDRRALIEQAHQLRELTQHPGWSVLSDLVLMGPGGSASHQRRIVNGAESWDDYLIEVGIIKGIHLVIDAPARAAAMAANAQEEDE